MAERQGKLGNSWNDCAGKLLKLLGWELIGDSDIDLKGSDSKEYGVDSILKYTVAGKSMKQVAILESKRYAQASLQTGTLQKWMERLKDKLNALRNSKDLLAEFSTMMEDCLPVNLGVIMVWVHDADEGYLNGTFQRYLENTIISTAAKADGYSRIMVLDNRRIVRLCSMVEALNKYDRYSFVYPAGIVDNEIQVLNKVLSVEYMMSDIIIAKGVKNKKEKSLVFYFGKMTEDSVSVLMDCLNVYQRAESTTPLVIYYYDSNDNTINVINSYKKKDCYKKILEFEKLTHFAYNDEPALIANDD